MLGKVMRRLERANPFRIGVVMFVVLAVGGAALFQKTQLTTMMSPGETVQADFKRDYHLRAYVTKVKVSGVRVGIVTDVERQENGEFRVSMKLDDGIEKKLGSTPSASVRPTTLLGGNYYVALDPGGDPSTFDGVIPASRTTTPVELDRVLEALKPSVRESLPRTVARLDSTLDADGRKAVRRLVKEAPGTLDPAAPLVDALRGTRPGSDLQNLVGDLESLAAGLSKHPDELAGAVDGLASTSAILASQRNEIADAVDSLPSTLQSARTGLDSLDGTLDQLRVTAGDVQPAAEELEPLLKELDPALTKLSPVVRQLRPTLRDLRPLIKQLVSVSTTATDVLDDLDEGPLQKVNGPIMETVLSPWKGTGDYAQSGNDTVFYKELGNLIAGMNNAGRMTDRNGSTIHFQPGFGIGSVSGTPISFEQLFRSLLYPQGDQ